MLELSSLFSFLTDLKALIPPEIFQLWPIAVVIIIALILVLIFYHLLKAAAQREARFRRSIDSVCLQVLIPKQLDVNGQAATDPKSIQDQISLAENIFANIGSLKPESGFKVTWRGRQDQFSLELVAKDKLIYFYWVVPYTWQLFIEQQIHSQYPSAEIQVVDDYNVFDQVGFASASELKLVKDVIFPIKTYKSFESDPTSSILTALSRFGEEEAGVVQIVVRTANKNWSQRSKKVAKMVSEGKSLEQALKEVGVKHSFNFGTGVTSAYNQVGFAVNQIIGDAFSQIDTKNKENKSSTLTPQEQETLRGLESKATKAGLGVTIRLMTVAKTKETADANLQNLESSFGAFAIYQYGNGFEIIRPKKPDSMLDAFIFRDFSDQREIIFNTEELASIYHLPVASIDVPNIVWLLSKKAPAPTNMPVEGTRLGYNEFRGRRVEVMIKDIDRFRHLYTIGKSGSGKSTLLVNMAIQDIQRGKGICYIDPHGDDCEQVLNSVPKSRAEDVIYFSPANLDRPMGLNLLEYDERYPEQKTFAINEMLKIFDKLYDLKSTGGPMFEQYMRNAMLLLMDSPDTGSTLMEIPKVLADENFRAMKLRVCQNQSVKDFWLKEALKAGGEASLQNMVPYITSKLTPFISNDYMRPIIGQQKSSFNLREVMDGQKILLLNLSKGKLGDLNAYLIGMVLVGKILMAALSRTDIPQDERKQFFLYIDEFQNFLTESISAILSEARKYGLSLNIAHQFIGQLTAKGDTTIRDAIFGNVGTLAVFRIGSDDAKELDKEFSPTFNEYDLINVPARQAFVKLLIDGTASKPFNMSTYAPPAPNKKLGNLIGQLSSLKYGRDRRIVEEEIRLRGLVAGSLAKKNSPINPEANLAPKPVADMATASTLPVSEPTLPPKNTITPSSSTEN